MLTAGSKGICPIEVVYKDEVCVRKLATGGLGLMQKEDEERRDEQAHNNLGYRMNVVVDLNLHDVVTDNHYSLVVFPFNMFIFLSLLSSLPSCTCFKS